MHLAPYKRIELFTSNANRTLLSASVKTEVKLAPLAVLCLRVYGLEVVLGGRSLSAV